MVVFPYVEIVEFTGFEEARVDQVREERVFESGGTFIGKPVACDDRVDAKWFRRKVLGIKKFLC